MSYFQLLMLLRYQLSNSISLVFVHLLLFYLPLESLLNSSSLLLFCYRQLVLASNRKNTDQHIFSLGWSLDDNNREAAVIEFLDDKEVPRIELPGAESFNLCIKNQCFPFFVSLIKTKKSNCISCNCLECE